MPMREQGLSVAFRGTPVPALQLDKDAIAQAIVNLLDNAVKYSGGRNEIDVSVTASGAAVRIAVRDRGIGIPAGEQKKIYEKFYRVGSTLVHDIKGSGLGLSIVLHVVQAHGGRMELVSAPGQGSTLHHRPAAGAERESADAGHGVRMNRILIVEDDPAMTVALRDGFEFEKYAVQTAVDGEEGFRLASRGDHDLMILDVMLPRKSGLDVCKELRRNGSSTPIIMLTARGQEIDKIVGLKLGADDYVTKPFSFMELLARVEAILRRVTRNAPEEEYAFGDVNLDFRTYQASKGGLPLDLTPARVPHPCAISSIIPAKW